MTETLQQGARGSEVVRVQQRLLALGYELPRFGADGILGQETLAAMQLFLGLPQKPSELTLTVLEQLFADLPGVDVSKYQGIINWHKVAESGKRFAYIRLSFSQSLDPLGALNWDGAQGAGLLCGGYHFFRNSTSVDKQVDTFLKIFEGGRSYGSGCLPPALDLEWDSHGSPVKTTTARKSYVQAARAWVEAVRDQVGLSPIIYTGPNFWKEIGNPAELKEFGLWLADPGSLPKLPKPWSNYLFWQYSHTGKVDGIEGAVDLNLYRGGWAQLRRLTMPSGTP